MRRLLTGLGALAVSGCSQPLSTAPSDLYFEQVSALCAAGAFAGELVSEDEVDAGFRAQTIIMGPAVCDGQSVRIPLAVGDDRSRTWVVTRTEDGVRLKHDHRHKDGSEDALSQYGGDSLSATATRHEFPVDPDTRALFTREGIEVSNQNTWAIEIRPGTQFAYEMSRPERFFRLEFDLSGPVPAPPLPWGVEPIE